MNADVAALLTAIDENPDVAELRRALPNCKIAGDGWEPSEPLSDPFEK